MFSVVDVFCECFAYLSIEVVIHVAVLFVHVLQEKLLTANTL